MTAKITEEKAVPLQTVLVKKDLLDELRKASKLYGFRITALVEQGIKLRLAQLEESK